MADDENNWESDEEDEDYVPPDGDISDVEVSDAETEDEEDNPALANPRKKNIGKKLKKQSDAGCNEKGSEKLIVLTPEDEKKKIDSLWADFVSDSTVTSNSVIKRTNTPEACVQKSEENLKTAATKPSKVTVTELFEFAGETVEVQKVVDDVAPTTKNETITTAQEKSGSGSVSHATIPPLKRPATSKVGNILAQIGSKKSKLSVLEKTSLDWKSFKKEEGIEEDLKIHNKGKDGYLDKMAFLERTDLRQFEIEKRIRSINRSHKS